MNIESLEIKLLQSSKIEDGDVVIVKVDMNDKKIFEKESIQKLYSQIKNMLNNKDISIYFFPKNLDIDFIKANILNIEKNKEEMNEQIENQINEK